MTRQMKKAVYEAPLTEHFQVELEGVFCASANLNNSGEKNDQGIIDDQQINTGFNNVEFNGTGSKDLNGWGSYN